MFKNHYFSLGALSPHRWLTSVASIFFLVSWLWAGQAQAQVPTITSFSPLSAKPADAVTITGTNFNTTAANNIVFFGATKANVTAATATSLTVTVPTGATYAPITVLNTGTTLAAYSKANFNPIYSPAKTTITTSDFSPKHDFATGTGPFSVAIGDLDGDGKPDLAVANYDDNTVSVLRNTSTSGSIGSSSFAAKEDFATGTSPYSVAIGDLDGDGKPDLATGNYDDNTVSVLRNTSTSGSITSGSFAAKVDFATGTGPYSVAIGDLDGDGKPDLATANYGLGVNTVSVLRNTSTSGSTSFAAKVDFATGSSPISVAIGDLDGDGKPDLAVANYTPNSVSVFRNTSTSGSITSGSFAAMVDFATGSSPISVAIGDLDGDGKPDLAVANRSATTVSVLRNTSTSGSIGSGSFAAKEDFATGTSPRSVAIGDLDGDGKPDLAVANYLGNKVSVLRNTSTSGSIGSGSFAAKVDFATGTSPRSVAIGDLDGDGKPDLAVANNLTVVNTVSVLRNADIVPTITSFSPLSAKPADAVTITGTNFNTTAANNIVFFGATKANVTAATATSLTVTVPTGATYAPITVLNTGTTLAAYSKANFNPIYSPAKTAITTSDFSPKQDFATGTRPISVAIGDLDGDGKPDLAVANSSNSVSVLRNTSTSGSIGSGSFAAKVDFATGAGPSSVAIGDLDGDGKPDLAVANYDDNTVSVLRNTSTSGSTSFAAKVDFATGTGPISVAIGDLDGDGKPDLAVANRYENTVYVLRNTSTSGSITSGSFAAMVDFATGAGPNSVAIGDLDGDGKPDLAVANSEAGVNTVSVLRNTSTSGSIGSDSFAAKVDFATGTSPYSVAIGDLDGDGKPDLATANIFSNSVSVLRNTSTSGSTSFATKVDFATGALPYSVAIGDLDGDGKPDLATANYDANTVSVLRNTSTIGSIGSGSFAAKVDFATGTGPSSVAIGDLDGDGKPDLATANNGSNMVSVLRNADIATPTITTTGTLTAFTACAGTASAQQSFTVSGSNLTNNITVTAPAGFEISTVNNSGFATTPITLTQSGGNVSITTIYVRMAATATGTPSGNVTCASSGATDKTVAVSGTANTNPSVIINKSSSSICVGATLTLTASAPLPELAGLAPFVPLPSDGYAWASSGGTFVSSTGSPGSTGSPISWSSGSSGGVTFTVTATNSNNCSATATATVLVNENPSVSISPLPSSICVGATLNLTASPPNPVSAGLSPDANPVFSDGYAWASSGGTFNSSAATATFSSSSAGGFNFTVTATNTNSCSATATASVTVGNASITAMPPTSICAGATINLTASGGISYSWVHSGGGSFSSSTNPVTFNSSSAGGFGFTVTATVTGGCTATATTSVSVKANPSVVITPSATSVCVGKSINLNASTPLPQSAGLAPFVPLPSDGYAWASSGGTFVSSTGSPGSTGSPISWSSGSSGGVTFTVTATNSNNCSATATATVLVNENPSVSISPLPSSICVGATLNLTASPPNPVSAGLSPDANPVFSDGYAWASSGGTFNSSAATATFYSSSTGGFGFTVTATNSNSCSATATASVTVGNGSITAMPPTSICAGATINLTASGGISYSWVHSGGGNFSSTTNPVTFNSSSAGGFGFTVTATVSGGCTATATTSVSVKANPTVSINPATSSICVGKTLNLIASTSPPPSAGLAPGVTILPSDGYAWASSGGGTFISSTNQATFSSSSAGGFGFTVTATNANSCSATATASVTVNANPSVSISPGTSSLCTGQTLELRAGPPNPSSAGLSGVSVSSDSYTWASSGGGTFVSSTNPATFSSNIAGGFRFTVTASNSNSCSATATASATVNTKPALAISQSNNQVCAGVSINLTATSGLSNYSWVHSGGTFTSTTNEARFSSGAGGTFTFTVTAGNSSCSNSATTTVLVYGVSSANLSFAPICALGNPLNLSASGGGSYSWRGPNGFKSSSATPSKAKTVAKDEGIYSVTVSSTLGCTSTSTIKVYIGVGKVTATSNSTVCKGGTIQLSATAEFGASYKWTKQFSSVTYQGQNPTIPNAQPSNGGVYLVFVTGVNGCVVKEEVLVVVSSRACTSGRLASGEEVEGMEMEVNTYPNPTSKLLTVEVKLAKPSSLNLQLFNATGNTLTEWNLSEESTIHRKEIDLSIYKDGLYLIQAQSKDGKQTKRVMKIE